MMDLLSLARIKMIVIVNQHVGRLGDGREREPIKLSVIRPCRCKNLSNRRPIGGA